MKVKFKSDVFNELKFFIHIKLTVRHNSLTCVFCLPVHQLW